MSYPIPENLKARWEPLNTWIRGPITHDTEMPHDIGPMQQLMLIERIAKAEAEIAALGEKIDSLYEQHNQEIARLEKELATAKAAVERLSAPVSDDEEHLWAQELNEGTGEWTFSKGSIYQLLAARKESQ